MADKPSGFRSTFRSLSYPNYRLFFGGQGISLIGTWIQRIAMPWLVYDTTKSVLLLGVVGFVAISHRVTDIRLREQRIIAPLDLRHYIGESFRVRAAGGGAMWAAEAGQHHCCARIAQHQLVRPSALDRGGALILH